MVPTSAIIGLAVIGGLAHVVATVVWYEPVDIPSPSVPLLEAGIFGTAFTVFYLFLGFVFRTIGRYQPPLGEYALIGISVFGLVSAVGLATGRFGANQRPNERVMGTILGGMVWLLPLGIVIVRAGGTL